MLPPGCLLVLARLDAHRAEYLPPKPFFGLFTAKLRENLSCPGRRRHGNHAPGVLVVHKPGPILKEGRPSRLAGKGQLFSLYVLKDFRVPGSNGDKSRPLFRIILVETHFPLGKFRKDFLPALGIADMSQLLITPAHHHIMSTGLKSLLCYESGKICALNGGIDDQQLVLLNIHPYFYHQIGVFL